MTTLIEPPIRSRESALRALTRVEFHQPAAVPAEAEGFANLDNPTLNELESDRWVVQPAANASNLKLKGTLIYVVTLRRVQGQRH